MARRRKSQSWREADLLRIRSWFHGVLNAFFPDSLRPRSVDLDRYFQKTSMPIASSRLSSWKNGRSHPSPDWLARIRRANKSAGEVATWLVAQPCMKERRLENLFLVLEATSLKQGRREYCLTYLDQIARAWRPEIEVAGSATSTRNLGWRLPILGGLRLSPVIVNRLNPFDPISVLNFHLILGLEIRSAEINLNIDRISSTYHGDWLTDWGFDLLCQVLLISTLVTKEMTEFELHLAGDGADTGIWLRNWFLHEGFTDPDPHKVARMLSTMNFEQSEKLVSLLLECRQKVFSNLATFGIDISRVLTIFPGLMPPVSVDEVDGVRRALRKR